MNCFLPRKAKAPIRKVSAITKGCAFLPARELSEALISTLVSYKSDVAEYIKLHDSVVRAVDNVRVLGAVSLDLACVAGRQA